MVAGLIRNKVLSVYESQWEARSETWSWGKFHWDFILLVYDAQVRNGTLDIIQMLCAHSVPQETQNQCTSICLARAKYVMGNMQNEWYDNIIVDSGETNSIALELHGLSPGPIPAGGGGVKRTFHGTKKPQDLSSQHTAMLSDVGLCMDIMHKLLEASSHHSILLGYLTLA